MADVRALYKITGVSPLLQNNPAQMLTRDDKPKARTLKPAPEEDAAASAYSDGNGGFYHPAEAFRQALKGGAKGMKAGKMSAVTLCKGVFETHERVELLDPETEDPLTEYEIDIRRAVIQKQGIPRARAKFPTWMCYLELEFDNVFLSTEQVELFLNRAGKLIGVGDYRPDKSGPFGRFKAQFIDVKLLEE